MPTVSKKIAEEQIKHNAKLKRPQMYCIAKYENTFSGNVDYSLCYREKHYAELFSSPAVSNVRVLWASERSGLTVLPAEPDYAALGIDPNIEDELAAFAADEHAKASERNRPKTRTAKKRKRA